MKLANKPNFMAAALHLFTLLNRFLSVLSNPSDQFRLIIHFHSLLRRAER